MWKELLIRLLITTVSLQMIQIYTSLHKVCAIEKYNNYDKIRKHRLISMTYCPISEGL
jgi:hypothetical protein